MQGCSAGHTLDNKKSPAPCSSSSRRCQIFLIGPLAAIVGASSGRSLQPFASTHGARIQTSRSSAFVNITGIAFRWIGAAHFLNFSKSGLVWPRGERLDARNSRDTRVGLEGAIELLMQACVPGGCRELAKALAVSSSGLACGRSRSDEHHVKFAEQRAMGRKVSDNFTVPLCRTHHRKLHQRGDERIWWKQLNVDPLHIARQLWKHTQANANAGQNAELRWSMKLWLGPQHCRYMQCTTSLFCKRGSRARQKFSSRAL